MQRFQVKIGIVGKDYEKFLPSSTDPDPEEEGTYEHPPTLYPGPEPD
jgi:hypothetical protein